MASAALAQGVPALNCDKSGWSDQSQARYCQMQEQTFSAPKGAIRIDPALNGGVTVKGWKRSDVLVRARIEGFAKTDAEAKAVAGQVRYASGGGQIKAEGPANIGNRWWSVSYEVFVPAHSDIEATTHNGGIRIQDVSGKISFQALNGGVTLARIGGEVAGKTTNGALTVELGGVRWEGKGLDVATSNGGVKLTVPSNYSAHLETSTVNGAVRVDFPITVTGKIGKQLSFDTGSGGATIRAVTINGGVTIARGA